MPDINNRPNMEIKLIKSTFFREQETKERLCQFISGAKQLSIGEKCAEFESAFGKWQGRAHCVMFNSGSSANLALLQALANMGRIKKGEAVAFSGVTWATNVMPIIQMGMEPVPADVELRTLNVSPESVEAAYRKRAFKALFVTNLLGFCGDMPAIREFCERKGILLLEDNCESLGSVYGGVKLGNFSQASTFSFFVGHHLSTLEGGMVATDDPELADELKKVRSHGWDRHLGKESQNKLRDRHGIDEFYAKYTFYDLAFNLRPTEIQGFLGLDQLEYLDGMVAKREENFHRFMSIFGLSDEFHGLETRMDVTSNFAFPLIAKNEEGFKRRLGILQGKGVEVRPIVGGLITRQPFFKKYVSEDFDLPNSRLIHDQGFYFGNNPEMTDEEVEYVIDAFRHA